MPGKTKSKAVVPNTTEHSVEAPTANGNGNSNPSAKDMKRPSIGDIMGRPSGNAGNNLASAALQVTRDQQNWLATGILTPREIAQAKRMMAKEMTRHGRLDMERLVFQAGHLARSRNGYSLEMYAKIAGAEMRMKGGFDGFYNRNNPGPPMAGMPQTQQGAAA
jgi:hypothetical protein